MLVEKLHNIHISRTLRLTHILLSYQRAERISTTITPIQKEKQNKRQQKYTVQQAESEINSIIHKNSFLLANEIPR